MKKTILTLIFSISLGFTLMASSAPTNNQLSEELLLDVPFNTLSIYNTEMANRKVMNLRLADEEMINDIPFDTERIFHKSNSIKAISMKLTDEQLVDDIPFNTSEIVSKLK